jgi:teichuronic acid biosynthesis glycosyltransferase TuaC
MRITVLSDNYPSQAAPTRGVFVYQLAQQFCRHNKVNVICPSVLFKQALAGKALVQDKCKVLYPKYLSFSKTNNAILYWLRNRSKRMAISYAFKNLYQNNPKPDFIYAHFLWNAISALPLKKRLDVPLFVAMGESNVHQYQYLVKNTSKLTAITAQISGFIVVSEKMKQFCINQLNINPQKILFAPNGVDMQKFYPTNNKKELRIKLGFDTQKFMLAFTGSFIERKGIFDIIKAIESLDNVQLICIGKGNLPPNPKIVFAGALPHEQINTYLNASDAFIFPTRAEGSSNALIEAAAAGLPIITSNIPEVKEQIGSENAIFITPGDVSELTMAIQNLISNENLCHSLKAKSLEVSKKYSLEKRANTILKWIGQKINK